MNEDKTTPTPPYRLRSGLSAIEHAALVTGQPCSGTPWLDEMLAKARRERLAGQALVGMIQNEADFDFSSAYFSSAYEAAAKISLRLADALIAAMEGGGEK